MRVWNSQVLGERRWPGSNGRERGVSRKRGPKVAGDVRVCLDGHGGGQWEGPGALRAARRRGRVGGVKQV